jgi:hypothetical protein
MITVIRKTDGYELQDSNGDTIKTYEQKFMSHPHDWIQDAVDHGVAGWVIAAGDWQVIDQR